MFAPLRLALLISLMSIVIYLAFPVLKFINDFTSNPECLKLVFENFEMINETHSKVVVNLYYCSTIELDNVSVVIGSNRIYFGQVMTGDNRRVVVASINDLKLRSIELTVARIFHVKLLFE